MTSKRRSYTDEFKREAVGLWESSDKSAAEVEAELGLSAGRLSKWKARMKRDGKRAFVGHGGRTPEQERIRQLERELAVTREERDILKKAVAIFSEPSA